MKMKNLKILKQIKLAESEKDELFSRILKSTGQPALNKPIKSPYDHFFGFFSSTKVKVALALVVFSFTSITTYASLNSLPGDILYPIKTKVLEKVADAVTFSSESKARRNSIKLERRIKEFEDLAEKGRLDEKKVRSIEFDSEKELNKFDKNIKKIPDDTEVKKHLNDDLENKVDKHREKIIKIIDDNKSINKKTFEAVLNRGKKTDLKKDDNKEKDQKKDEKINVDTQLQKASVHGVFQKKLDNNVEKSQNNDKNKSGDRLDGNGKIEEKKGSKEIR